MGLMNSESLTITGRFDGGNPQDPADIERLGDAEFRITPFSEDGAASYRFNLNVQLTNAVPEPLNVTLHLNWCSAEFNQYRQFVQVEHNGSVRRVPGKQDGEVITVSFEARQGTTRIFLNRPYSYEQLTSYVDGLEGMDNIEVGDCGETNAGRRVPLVIATGAHDQQSRLLVVGRIHPYETASSYVVEGVIGALGETLCAEMGVGVAVVPMGSPDGVHDGCCKLNARDGIDLSREVQRDDRGCAALLDAIDQFRPTFLVELHSWMIQDKDGVYYESPRRMRRFANAINERQGTNREWSYGVRRRFFAKKLRGLKGYVKSRFGGRSMTIEYPWCERSEAEMRSLGACTLDVFVEMLSR